MPTSIYQQNLIDRRKKAGLCRLCGEPLDRDGTHCRACRDKLNKEAALERKFYQSQRICPECRKNKLFGDEKQCPECNAKFYSQVILQREKNREEYNAYYRAWRKKTFKERKEAGICIRCGKRKAEEGFSTCKLCREKANKTRHAREGFKPDRKERYKQGLCYWCDNPIKEGFKVCEKHYQMNVEKAHSQGANKAREKYKKIENKRINSRRNKNNEINK